MATGREILGEIRFRLSTDLKRTYPESYGARGFIQTTEPYFIKTMFNVDLQAHDADYYIGAGDGAGPIVILIGAPGEDGWGTVLSTDGQPVRVLSVALDGAMCLSHPRHTRFEEDLMTILEAHAGVSQ